MSYQLMNASEILAFQVVHQKRLFFIQNEVFYTSQKKGFLSRLRYTKVEIMKSGKKRFDYPKHSVLIFELFITDSFTTHYIIHRIIFVLLFYTTYY